MLVSLHHVMIFQLEMKRIMRRMTGSNLSSIYGEESTVTFLQEYLPLMGAGINVDIVLNVEPNNVASREVIDRQTPNPDVCIANGMSAMVLDQHLFISFNP